MIVDLFAISFATELDLGKQPENYHAVPAESSGTAWNRSKWRFFRKFRDTRSSPVLMYTSLCGAKARPPDVCITLSIVLPMGVECKRNCKHAPLPWGEQLLSSLLSCIL